MSAGKKEKKAVGRPITGATKILPFRINPKAFDGLVPNHYPTRTKAIKEALKLLAKHHKVKIVS